MENLLSNYSVSDILLFLAVFALAAKEFVTFIDWAKLRWNKDYTEKKQEDNMKETVSWGVDQINSLESKVNQLDQKLDSKASKLDKKMDLLIISDKDDIKAFLTKEYHYFSKKGWIDDYSLDCCERRFGHYKVEGGNSFIEHLMEELRKLPHKPVDQEKQSLDKK